MCDHHRYNSSAGNNFYQQYVQEHAAMTQFIQGLHRNLSPRTCYNHYGSHHYNTCNHRAAYSGPHHYKTCNHRAAYSGLHHYNTCNHRAAYSGPHHYNTYNHQAAYSGPHHYNTCNHRAAYSGPHRYNTYNRRAAYSGPQDTSNYQCNSSCSSSENYSSESSSSTSSNYESQDESESEYEYELNVEAFIAMRAMRAAKEKEEISERKTEENNERKTEEISETPTSGSESDSTAPIDSDKEEYEFGNLEGMASLSSKLAQGLGKINRNEEVKTQKKIMEHIYGEKSSTIAGLETAMALSFERLQDIHQPSVWPVLPVRL